MAKYYSLREILIAALRDIPDYKLHFYGMFIQNPMRVVEKLNPEVNAEVRAFAEEEPEYFDVLDEFINIYLAKYYNKKVLSSQIFNQAICLSILIPDIVEFLYKHADEIEIFSTSQAFLSYATSSKVPIHFFPHLALLLITDEMSYNVQKIKDLEKRQKMELTLDAIKIITVNSMKALGMFTKIADSKPRMTVKAKPTDIFTYKDRSYGIKLFDGMNARVNIILADRGCGKTIALFRFIHSLLKKGYTVIAFGEDRRKEFRYASFPMKQEINNTYYHTLYTQGTAREGMPIKIYCDDPEYPIEKKISEFRGSAAEWDNLKGVVLFESKNVTEKEIRDSYTKNKKGVISRETFKLVRKAELSRIMESFLRWRSADRSKKIALCLNEAQNFIGSTVDKSTWGIFHNAEQLFTDIRGLGVPVVMNTQYLSKLKKSGRQSDVLIVSHITDANERRLVANIYNKPNLNSHLAIPSMKQDHEFFKIEYGKQYKIKFLLPPYMPENKIPLSELFKKGN